jgi:hypothetical protein
MILKWVQARALQNPGLRGNKPVALVIVLEAQAGAAGHPVSRQRQVRLRCQRAQWVGVPRSVIDHLLVALE